MTDNANNDVDMPGDLELWAGEIEASHPDLAKGARSAAAMLRELDAQLTDTALALRSSLIAGCRWQAWYVAKFNTAFPPEEERPPRVLQLKCAIAAYGHEKARALYPQWICTEETPWTPEQDTGAAHPDSVEVGEQRDGHPGGDMQDHECPHCKHRWTVELPQ